MRFDSIIRKGQDFLRSEQGRSMGRKAADAAASAARKAAPKKASSIDRAQRAAHDYLDRQGGGARGTRGQQDVRGPQGGPTAQDGRVSGNGFPQDGRTFGSGFPQDGRTFGTGSPQDGRTFGTGFPQDEQGTGGRPRP